MPRSQRDGVEGADSKMNGMVRSGQAAKRRKNPVVRAFSHGTYPRAKRERTTWAIAIMSGTMNPNR